MNCNKPFLVRQNVAADFLLLALNELDIGEYAVSLEPLCEFGWGNVQVMYRSNATSHQ